MAASDMHRTRECFPYTLLYYKYCLDESVNDACKYLNAYNGATYSDELWVTVVNQCNQNVHEAVCWLVCCRSCYNMHSPSFLS